MDGGLVFLMALKEAFLPTLSKQFSNSSYWPDKQTVLVFVFVVFHTVTIHVMIINNNNSSYLIIPSS